MDNLPDITMDIVEEPQPEPEQPNIKETIEEDNDEIMEQLEKPRMKQEEIFADPPKIKVVKEPKKKRVLSEEHKQKLASAREKALLVRRQNAALKKEEKELTKKVKQKKMTKLREEASDEHVEETVKEVIQHDPQLSQKQMEAIALNSIIGYEKIRKARKHEKKQSEQVVRQQQILKQQLRETVNPKPQPPQFYSTNGVWDDFF